MILLLVPFSRCYLSVNFEGLAFRVIACLGSFLSHKLLLRKISQTPPGLKGHSQIYTFTFCTPSIGFHHKTNPLTAAVNRRQPPLTLVEMWQRAGLLAAEIKRSQKAPSGTGDAMRQLRKFVDRFVTEEIGPLQGHVTAVNIRLLYGSYMVIPYI